MNKFKIKKKSDEKYIPFSSHCIYDNQIDDEVTSDMKRRYKICKKLDQIKTPEQHTPEWFSLRKTCISASDAGTAVKLNHNEAQFSLILKKVEDIPFIPNEYCYHGTKFETIARMIYEYRANVRVKEYGLMKNKKIDYLGASPDGIATKYKYNGKNIANLVGRMLEIKCPAKRTIYTDGEIYDHICPAYYFAQIQQQLECCDLDECDFWQCKILEYASRDDFIKDTDRKEKFRTKKGLEKGCLLQLIPKDKIANALENYNNTIYECAKFIYPSKIEMDIDDCDKWVTSELSNLNKTHPDWIFDKIIYWKLKKSSCVTIQRDKKWFAEKLPILKKMWDYITFYRNNKKAFKKLKEFIDKTYTNNFRTRESENEIIMEFVKKQYKKMNKK